MDSANPSRNWFSFASTRQAVKTQAVPLLLGSVLGANVITMAVMNFFELETWTLLPIYLSVAILTTGLLVHSAVKCPELRPADHALSLLLGILFCLPRIPYLLEGILGYAVDPYHDDWAHVQYMASLIDSPRFPPLSTFDGSQFLSYYYAPWILGAALQQTSLFTTVKQVLALTDFAYAIFAAYCVVYASKILFKDRGLQRAFLTLCILYGGFDFLYWLSGMSFRLTHAEWWAADFGINIQYSSFFTLLLWVPQHVAATVAFLYGLYVVCNSDSVTARVSAGILLSSAAFSSPFVVFGAIPLTAVLTIRNGLYRAAPIVLLVSVALASPLVWIFLNKDSAGYRFGLQWFGELDPFFMQHKRAAFIVFIVITLLELGPLLWMARSAFVERQWSRWLVLASSIYLLSIFFIHYFGSNYCMRGAIIPIFTLAYVATPSFHRILSTPEHFWYRVALIPYFLGGLYEYASFSTVSFDAVWRSNTPFNVRALESNRDDSPFVNAALVRESRRHDRGWYVLEKRKSVVKEPMDFAEAATFHGDNPYRLTLRSVSARFFGAGHQAELPRYGRPSSR